MPQVGLVLRDVTVGRVILRFRLRDLGLGLRHTGVGRLPGRSLGIVVRFGDQGRLVQALGSGPIELRFFRVRLGPVQVGQCGIQAGLGRYRVGLRGAERSLGRIQILRGLHVFELRQQLPLLYPIAFLDIELGNLAEGIGADVHVDFRLDFTRSADNRGQIQPLCLARLNCDHILVALVHREADDRRQQDGHADADPNFLSSAHGSPEGERSGPAGWLSLVSCGALLPATGTITPGFVE